MSNSQATNNPCIRWARETDRKGIPMKLVGTWQDILAYYEDPDGNVWSVSTHGGWTFAAHSTADIGTRLRGSLV